MVHASRWPRVLVVLSLAVVSMYATARAQTFSAPLNVANNTNDFSFTPRVAVNSNGNVFVVWEDDTATTNNILFSRSTDGGKTFSVPVNISNSTGFPFNPRMAVDSQGAINVVYIDDFTGPNAVYFSRSTDGGTTFSKPVNLSSQGSQASATTPQIAVDGNGNIHVLWVNSNINFGTYYTRSINGGASFSAPIDLDTNTAGSFAPQLAIDASGNIYVVWDDMVSGQLDIFFTVSKNNGASFAAAQNVSNNSGNSITPQLALDPSGNINVVWADSTPGSYNTFFSRSADGGATFATPTNVSGSAGTAGKPLVAVDAKSNLFVVWQDTAPPATNDNIWFARSSDGGATFSTPQNLSNGTINSANAALTVDPSGNIDISWEESVTSKTQIYFTQSLDSGATFSTPQNVSNDGGTSENVQMSADSQGNLNVVWDDDAINATNQIFFSRLAASKAANTAPTANAGADQTLTATGPTTPVTLQGSGSDPDGDALTFVWTQGGAVVGNGASVTLNLNIGTYTFTLTVTDSANQSAMSTTHVTVNNAPPVANAGLDQTVTATGATTPVTLHGSGSDVDGDVLTYVWTQGSTVLGNSATLPVSLSVGTYTFTLTVTDAGGLSASAVTHVTVNNAPPVANAGADQTLTATGQTTPVTLHGSGSDPDGEALTFTWTQGTTVLGNLATLPISLSIGTYTFTLTVTDAGGLSASAVTHVTVNNAPPVANAGSDQTLTATGATTPVTLHGAGSDPDGDALTFVWTQGATVLGNTPTLPLSLAIGTYTFTLTVTDAGGLSASAITHVTVNNAPPVANAGVDQTLTATGQTTAVTLQGSGSDPDGEALSFAWTQGTTVLGNSATLPLNLAIGTYTFTLTVTDAGGLSASAVTHVTINNAPPVANAGTDQTVTASGLTTPVTLHGAGSDVDGDALTFSWTQGTTVVGNSAVLPVNLRVGTYTFTLTVTDAGGLSASAVTHVTVNNAAPVANAGADQTLTATGATTPVTLHGSGSDVDGDALTFVWTQGTTVVGNSAVLPLNLAIGSYTFTLTVSDAGGLSASAVTHVTINPRPPVAVVAADPTFECTSPTGTSVTLNGSASNDPNGYSLKYVWTDGSGQVVGNSAVVMLKLGLGTYQYTLVVTDSAGYSSLPAQTSVTVQDKTPPKLSFSLSTNGRRLRSNQFVLVNANVQVSDACDANPSVQLVSITSNDPADRRQVRDIESATGGPLVVGTDIRSFRLRAERPENGQQLVYTVTYSAADHSGNTTTPPITMQITLSAR